MKQSMRTPLWREGLIAAGMAGGISAALVMLGVKPYLTRTPYPWLLLLLSGIAVVIYWKDYLLSPDGIVCRHFFIPHRRLKWTDISDAVFLNEWNDFGNLKKENVLLITLKPCRPYDDRIYSIFSYRFHFRRKTIFIHLRAEQTDRIAAYFQDCLEPSCFRDMRK